MNRYSIPMVIENGVGLTKRCRCAYSQPDSAASSAATTKIASLERAVFTPIASAITVPPLSARIARPSRLSSRLPISQIAAATSAQIARLKSALLSMVQPNRAMFGRLLMPPKPPRCGRLPNR
ncbi:hypothetical protein D9M71_428730 [compost metagenome]